jgi:hypothetical protein
MNVAEVEELAALAENCSEAEALGDRAAREALENELHARMSIAEIRNLEAPDPRTGERSASETDRLRGALERIWSNASARLD